jgi:hypothetical protein
MQRLVGKRELGEGIQEPTWWHTLVFTGCELSSRCPLMVFTATVYSPRSEELG